MADLAILDPSLLEENDIKNMEVEEADFTYLEAQIFSFEDGVQPDASQMAECDRIIFGP